MRTETKLLCLRLLLEIYMAVIVTLLFLVDKVCL